VRTNESRESGKFVVSLAIFRFPMLSVGFRTVLDAEPDMRVVGGTDPDSLVEDVRASGADVVISECQPSDASGCSTFASIEAIKEACPGIKVIALECRCGAEQFSLALKAGADGFLTREASGQDVVAAVRGVLAGHTYVSPAIVTRMVNTYVLHLPQGDVADTYGTLSEREREVLLLAAMGQTTRQIAESLHLSEQTIHNYRSDFMEKLGLHDRVELLKYAIRRGILNVADL
jgi:two-component system response regulator NreC